MDLLTGRIFAFVLVLTRVGAFLAVAPIFSWGTIPRRIKVCVVIVISAFFSAVIDTAQTIPTPNTINPIMAGIWIGQELLYGAALGLICWMLFSTVRIAGRIGGRQMGFALANVIDPVTGQNAQPLSVLLEILFILLLLAANGHHLLLRVLAVSYESFPVGRIPELSVLAQGVITTGSTMLLMALKLAAPILGAFLLLMVVLAVMARMAPEANILFLSLPLRVGLGMIMVGLFLPFISTFVKEMARLMDRLLPL